MDDFTQRLLEKKNARKRKQEEASIALNNIILQSDAKKSPQKSRNVLVERNEAETHKHPVPKPRKDIPSSKVAVSPAKGTGRKPLQSENKPQASARYERNSSNNSKLCRNDSESINDRMAKLEAEKKRTEDQVLERKRRRHLELERERNGEQKSSSSDARQEKGKVEKSSGSINDRLALFETNKRKASQLDASAKSSQKDCTTDARYGRKDGIHSGSKQKENGKIPKTSSRNDVGLAHGIHLDDPADRSCSLDYDSDENPFDVSAILKEADKAEQRESKEAEFVKASWSVTDYLTDDSPKVAEVDPGNKRASVYSNDGNDEEMSVFAKQIAQKRRAIKNPHQQSSLNKIDENFNERSMKTARHTSSAKEHSADRAVAREEKKDTRDHRKDKKEEKRRAPKRPEEDYAKVNSQVVPRKEVETEKIAEKAAPPKPARKNKIAHPKETQMAVDNYEHEMMERDALEKEQKTLKLQEEGQKRAREEQERKMAHKSRPKEPEELKIEKQKKNSKREETASAKKVKHAEKALHDEKNNRDLADIREDDKNSQVNTKEVVFSPNSSAYKSVREKSSVKPRKNMRRSMSFSEGHPPPMHHSGYNEEASSMYNVVTNCAAATVKEEKTKFEKIKELLDYAASQQSIVIQASQALNMSLHNEERKGSPEIVEGERLLLLANERKIAFLQEVERVKRGTSNEGACDISREDGACLPCKANLMITDIKLPLNADFLLALRGGRMDLGVFHFVVLIQYGPTQISATKVKCTYDELSRNFLTFKEKIELKNIPHDFNLTIKIFGMHTKRPSDSSSRGKKQQQNKDSPGLMKNVFSSLTPRRRMNSADDSPGSSPKPVFRTTSFTPCGSTKINLALLKSAKHPLTQVPKNCPLEGFIELLVDCQPLFTASARGFLTILEEVGGYTAWNRRWSVMEGDSISFWRFPDEETSKPSIGGIDLTHCVNKCIDMIPRSECSRPNTFELIVKRSLTKNDVPSLLATIEGKEVHIKNWVSADNKEDRIAWMQTLNRQLADSRAWLTKGHRANGSHQKHAVAV